MKRIGVLLYIIGFIGCSTVQATKVFYVPISESEASWSRANVYLAKNVGYNFTTAAKYIVHYRDHPIENKAKTKMTIMREIHGDRVKYYVHYSTLGCNTTQPQATQVEPSQREYEDMARMYHRLDQNKRRSNNEIFSTPQRIVNKAENYIRNAEK